MKNIIRSIIIVAIVSLFLLSCKNKANEAVLDTPISGTINISVDENYKNIISSAIEIFEVNYPNAKFNVKYLPESEAMAELMDDSTALVISGRSLTNDEIEYFKNKKIIPRITKIAYDALAFVINKNTGISNVTDQNMHDLLSGKINNWKQLGGKDAEIEVIFDNSNSGVVHYALDSLLHGNKLTSSSYATKNTKQVVDFVSQNSNAIGLISLSWIADRDEPLTTEYLSKINVLKVSKTTPDKAVYPYQSFIASKEYPYIRTVNTINIQGRAGLATGLVSFLANDRGQRLILKSGLLPSEIPFRLLDFED